MKRSLFALALACAASVCVAAVAAVRSDIDKAVALVSVACRAFKVFVLDGVALLAGTRDERSAPAVLFVKAMAFTLRKARRQRPEVSASWRMCPST